MAVVNAFKGVGSVALLFTGLVACVALTVADRITGRGISRQGKTPLQAA